MSDHVEIRGKVIEVQRDKFKIKPDLGGEDVLARLSGKMRQNNINVVLGDTVLVKVSPYDLTHGFIVKRE